MSWSDIKRQMSKALQPIYGQREADNIANYYYDAIAPAEVDGQKLAADIQLLREGKPVQQVTGLSFFYGYKFRVNDQVLIPRPETEELVHWILKDQKGRTKGLTILDIGVGSGCILLTLMMKLDVDAAYGLDVSESALAVLDTNATLLDVTVQPLHIDILSAELADLPEVDLIVSNPPYILDAEKGIISTTVLDYEPHKALFVDGEDPLIFYKRIIAIAQAKLKEGGQLYFETSHLYRETLRSHLDEQKLSYVFRDDLQGNPRMLKLTF